MNIIKEIENLYKILPDVNCKQCGWCCVSPTCTLAEFIYLMKNFVSNSSDKEIEDFLFFTPKQHKIHDGNFVCYFLKNNNCSIHKYRTGACRLFGIPEIEKLNLSNLVTCVNKASTSVNCEEKFIRNWLNQIAEINSKIYPFGRSPYFVYGFNLECWLDIYFDNLLTFEPFLSIRSIMKNWFDLTKWQNEYRQKTNLKEKIDKISILNIMINIPQKDTLKELLISIINDYPLTGTYFQKEAQLMLDEIEKQN
jgi:Fe-S-cluster containining protein